MVLTTMNQRLSVLVVEVQHDALHCTDSTSYGPPLVSTTLFLYMDSTGGLIMKFLKELIALAISIALLTMAGVIGYTAYHHHQEEHTSIEGWEPPVIPSCNKELWDRIREGCN